MKFKYPFKVVSGDMIPLLDVKITNRESGVLINYRAMLDSGAFANVFHSEIAQVLGIDLSKVKEVSFGGVKKSKLMRGKPYIVELMIMQKGKSYKFDSYVIFSDEISNTGIPLLGRQGFFDQFDEICFNYKANKFYHPKTIIGQY